MIRATSRFLRSWIAVESAEFPGLIQIRVRFVEHDQPRIAINSPRKAYPLPLAAGEPQPALADLRLIAVRQMLNHFMGVGKLCGINHRPVVNDSHARYVFPHGASEQLDILRHIADVATELNGIPVQDLGPVEPDLPRGRSENADDQSAQCALAGGRRANHGNQLAGLDFKADVAKDHVLSRAI